MFLASFIFYPFSPPPPPPTANFKQTVFNERASKLREKAGKERKTHSAQRTYPGSKIAFGLVVWDENRIALWFGTSNSVGFVTRFPLAGFLPLPLFFLAHTHTHTCTQLGSLSFGLDWHNEWEGGSIWPKKGNKTVLPTLFQLPPSHSPVTRSVLSLSLMLACCWPGAIATSQPTPPIRGRAVGPELRKCDGIRQREIVFMLPLPPPGASRSQVTHPSKSRPGRFTISYCTLFGPSRLHRSARGWSFRCFNSKVKGKERERERV